jgi:integrase
VICYVYKRKGRHTWRGRYRLAGQEKIMEVALKVSDRQVAIKKLLDLVRELEQESAGIIPPKSLRDAAQRELADHLKDYLADLEAQHCSQKHLNNVKYRVTRLIQDCRWKWPSHVTVDSFVTWRSKQTHSTKTLNDYLGAARALINWMKDKRRVLENPLAGVAEIDTSGRQTRVRRAFTVEEMVRLIAAAGPRKAVYLVAAHTGLRRSELDALLWRFVKLDATRPHLRLPGPFTKNGKDAILPLHTDVVAALRELSAAGVDENDHVFPRIPRIERFRRDLKKAGIDYRDAQGRFADFHALRYTFDTHLQRTGAVPRVAMELMRHSDMRLTMMTYTDALLLPTAEAINALPSYLTGTAGAPTPPL